MFRNVRIAAILTVAVLAHELSLDAASPTLFRAAGNAPAPQLTAKTKRAQIVGIDAQKLVRQSTDAKSSIQLNLFSDVALDGIVESTRVEGPGSFVTKGRIAWTELGSFTFVVKGDTIAGTVAVGEHRFRVLSVPGAAGQVVVSELVIPDKPDCACGAEHVVQAPANLKPIAANDDDGSTIDVLVAYTPNARTAVGGKAAMEALIDLAEEETNTAYQLSNVIQRVRVVFTVETNYNEGSPTSSTGFDAALNAITNPNDGKMDEIHSLRDQFGADAVSLIINNTKYCGLAWLMGTESATFESQAFSVVHFDCATGYYSFGHELGHNMGLVHDPANSGGPGARPYSYGHRWVGNSGSTWRSVMAYAPGTRVPRFANPDVLYDGVATGTANQANTARTLNETRVTFANFRESVLSNAPIIFSAAEVTTKPNQSFSYQIQATNSPTSFGATGLPSGLSVNTSNGLISGSPTETGDFDVLLSATNASGTGTLELALKVSSGGCGARTLVELNKALQLISPVRLGQLDDVLPTLRTLRDRVLLAHPDGKKLVDGYYAHGDAVSQLLQDNPALARQALPLLVELLPDLQAGVKAEGRFDLSRQQYEQILGVFEAAEQKSPAELRAWLTEMRQMVTRSKREATDDRVILDIALTLQGS